MLGPLQPPATSGETAPVGREAVLDATLRCLTAREYMLDGRPVERGLAHGLRDAIATCFDSAARLRLSITLGSFKSPRLASAPYPDWSEFLHLRYMLDRASELAAVYPFGLELSYVLLDLSTDEIAGVSREHARDYGTSFGELVRHVGARASADVAVRCVPLSGLVGQDEYEERMRENLASVSADWLHLPLEKVSVEMDKSRRAHLHVDGVDDGIVERAAKVHQALLRTLPQLAYYRDPTRVHILLRKSHGDLQRWVSQKSFRNSIVQFWVGYGCVAISTKRRWSATILSPNQLALRRQVGSIADFPAPVENPNLRAVPVYE